MIETNSGLTGVVVAAQLRVGHDLIAEQRSTR